jgi:predicted RNA-binding protein YlxR (DUF448 family)
MKNKTELIRVVKTQDGSAEVDLTGKKPGRGAYICKAPECVELAKKQRKIERGFEIKDIGELYSALCALAGQPAE